MTRFKFLESLLGKSKADEIKADIEAAQTALDKAGVERKNLKTVQKAEEEKPAEEVVTVPPEEEKQEGVPAATQAAIEAFIAALKAAGIEIPEEALNAALTAAAQVLADAEAAEAAVPVMEMAKSLKAIAGGYGDLVSDLGEIGRDNIELRNAVKSLAGIIKTIADQQDAHTQLLKSAPRAASKAESTEIANDKVSAEIKKSIEDEFTTELGVKVRKEKK